jgi:hypothetical protein
MKQPAQDCETADSLATDAGEVFDEVEILCG